jgi:hypothetical protein
LLLFGLFVVLNLLRIVAGVLLLFGLFVVLNLLRIVAGVLLLFVVEWNRLFGVFFEISFVPDELLWEKIVKIRAARGEITIKVRPKAPISPKAKRVTLLGNEGVKESSKAKKKRGNSKKNFLIEGVPCFFPFFILNKNVWF